MDLGHMFGTWLNNQHKKIKGLIWVGTATLCWAIWCCRNDVIFKKLKTNSIMQVIFRGAYWLRSWAQLQRGEQEGHPHSDEQEIRDYCFKDLK
jgi:RsiW-degrading membrane proteinase PrsW (M82 family)